MKDQRALLSSRQLTGYLVTSKEGETIGEVLGLDVDLDDWSVRTIEVRLRRTVIARLGMQRPFLGTRTVHIPTAILGEGLELLCPLDELMERSRTLAESESLPAVIAADGAEEAAST